METPTQNSEANDLGESKKNSIRLEEIYRQEIKQSLEKKAGEKSSPNRFWIFVNSSLGIWFLSTCIVGAITFVYGQHQKQVQLDADTARQMERDAIEIKQQQLEKIRRSASMVTGLLPYLASDKRKEVLLAITVTNFLKEKNELPGELTSVLQDIELSQKPEDREIANAAAAVLDAKPNTSQTNSTNVVSMLPARVYIQIGLAEQRSTVAKSIEAALEQHNFLVPGIENVGAKVPNKTEVRYYRDEEKTEAQSIITILQNLNLGLQLDPNPKKINAGSGARPRHYELWISKS